MSVRLSVTRCAIVTKISS